MNFTRRLLLVGSILGCGAPGHAQPLSESVQFYFSDAGGSNERITQDVVTGVNWTKEYDVYVRNVWHSNIEFNAAVLHVGYGQSNGAGPSATLIPFSDLVSISFPDQASQPIGSNPNITARAPWWIHVNGSNPFLGGGGGPAPGTLRPYGLHCNMIMASGTFQTLPVGNTMFLARISFKNRFLWQLGGSTTLSVYNGGGAQTGTSALMDFRPEIPLSYRTRDWQSNSTLQLTPVPEPISILGLATGLGILLRKRFRR